MSYDLYFKPNKESFNHEDFLRYFEARNNYQCEHGQAWYQNEDTGVYFVFEWQDEDEEPEEEGERHPVAFNMNYYRPPYFVYEAEPEVSAFVDAFSMTVEDPQSDGMGVGDYDSTKFISGWSHGNEFGYSAILKEDTDVGILPQDRLHSLWQWNYRKEEFQESVVDDVFVPQIMILKYQGRVITACVWPDAIPAVLPNVDFLIIGRDELAPSHLLENEEDTALGSWEDFETLIINHKTKMQNDGYYLSYEVVPQYIQTAVKALPSLDFDELERLPYDQVLSKELVNKYRP